MLIVGTEWLIEASGCDAESLRDAGLLRALVGRAVAELDLRVVGEPQWHKFPGEGGVTGLVLLSESHLACHTYPELGVATFNLYCCRARPRWRWEERLRDALGATAVAVREFERRAFADADEADTSHMISTDVSVTDVSASGVDEVVEAAAENSAADFVSNSAGGGRTSW